MATGHRSILISEQPISTIFERRTADTFRCQGFEMSRLGQVTGRHADVLALAPRERFAVIIDAKGSFGAELQRRGFEKVYFVVVASSFKDGDLKKTDGRVVVVSDPERQLTHSFGADAHGRR